MTARAVVVAVAALAGMAGCNGGQTALGAGSTIDIPKQPEPETAPPPPPHVAPAVRDAAPDAFASVAKAVESEPDETDDGPEDAGAGATCGWVDPASVTRPAAACAEDKGTVGACTAVKACRGVTFPKMKCEAFRKYFKPKVAQRALDCLGKLTDKQVCDACNAYRCGELALKTSCPDPSADAQCVQIAAICKAISMAECRLYLAGMNAAGRAKIAGCLASSTGCGFGIMSCTEGLF